MLELFHDPRKRKKNLLKKVNFILIYIPLLAHSLRIWFREIQLTRWHLHQRSAFFTFGNYWVLKEHLTQNARVSLLQIIPFPLPLESMLLRRMSKVRAFIPSGIDSRGRGSETICGGDDVYQTPSKYAISSRNSSKNVAQNVCDADHDIGVLYTWTIILSMCEKRLPRSVNQAAKLQVGGGVESPPNWHHLLGILKW